MKFSEMKIAKGPDPKWTALIADKNGNKDFELAIRGPETLVAQVFEKANFDFEIDPDASRESAAGRLKELHQKWAATAKEPFADPGHGFFKKPVASFDDSNSVVASLRRLQGKGTLFAISIFEIFLPAKTDFFWISPPAEFSCVGLVAPMAGDQDLYLTLNSPLPPIVSSSVRGGLAIDTVSHGISFGNWAPFVPVFRVHGFATGLGNFTTAQF